LHDFVIPADEEKSNLRFDVEKEITEAAWRGMKDVLNQYREKENENWWLFADLAMYLKILQPEQYSELQVNDEAWQGMKNVLNQYRKDKNWWDFAYLAMCLHILAAEKVEASDQGLEITMPQKKASPFVPPRPQRRES